MPLNLAAIIGYMQAERGPFYPNDVFDFIKWRFHLISGRFHYFEYQILSNIYDTKPISSETHNWYVNATSETEPKTLGFTKMTFQGVVEVQNILLILAPICFLWNNLWSVCRNITGPITGCSSQDGMVINM